MIPPKQLEGWLTTAFEHRPGWEIVRQQQVKSFQQLVVRVDLNWPGAGTTESVYVRVFRSYLSWWTFLAPDLPQREQAAWCVARRAGVPVPPILFAARSPDVLVLGRAPGEPGQIPDTPAKAAQAADLLVRLHAAPVRAEEARHLPDISLGKLLPRLASWADEAGSLTLRRELDAVAARFAEVDERPAGFVHGDWHAGNYLSDGQKVVAVLDLEEAALGDPRFDVANADAEMRRSTPHLADHFLSRYEVRAGFAAGDLRIWIELPYLRSRIMSALVAHRLASGEQLPSLNPEDWIPDTWIDK